MEGGRRRVVFWINIYVEGGEVWRGYGRRVGYS
jgi:hypothetical protein